MIKGWRNDPHWVAFYKRRDEARVAREIERFKYEMKQKQNQELMADMIRRMEKPKFNLV